MIGTAEGAPFPGASLAATWKPQPVDQSATWPLRYARLPR